jgi:hypothetical protein
MPIDYKKYPANWFTEIVPAIRKRSGDCCENCGRKHMSQVLSFEVRKHSMGKIRYRRDWTFTDEVPLLPKSKTVTVILTVAHLDHDATNHNVSLDRLKHLCQLCHLRMDVVHKARLKQCGRKCLWPACRFTNCFLVNCE